MPISTPTIAPTTAEFITDFPEFDTTTQQDPNGIEFGPSALNYWLQVAIITLNQSIWGNLYYTACELFMAHNLALEAWASQGGAQTVPGIAKGPIAASGAGDVNVAYDNAASLELDAGHWNYTMYGQRLIRMIRLVGVGPLYVGGGCCGPPYSGPAWPGPWCFNIPNPEL
jgi:hypothetical protein